MHRAAESPGAGTLEPLWSSPLEERGEQGRGHAGADRGMLRAGEGLCAGSQRSRREGPHQKAARRRVAPCGGESATRFPYGRREKSLDRGWNVGPTGIRSVGRFGYPP